MRRWRSWYCDFYQATLRRVRKNTSEDVWVIGTDGTGRINGRLFTRQEQASTRLCTISRDWTPSFESRSQTEGKRENKVTKGGLYERFRKLSRRFYPFFFPLGLAFCVFGWVSNHLLLHCSTLFVVWCFFRFFGIDRAEEEEGLFGSSFMHACDLSLLI